MISMILVDAMNWDSPIGPSFVVGKEELIPVYVGKYLDFNSFELILDSLCGIWIKTSDYDKIDHDTTYILIHDPEATFDGLPDYSEVKEKGLPGEHVHFFKRYNSEFDVTTRGKLFMEELNDNGVIAQRLANF